MTATQEFDARQDRWVDIADTLDRRGAVLVRHGVAPQRLAALLAEARAIYARRDAQHAAGTLPAEHRDLHLTYRAIHVTELIADGAPAQQWLVGPLVTAVATLLLRKAPQISEFSAIRCARTDLAHLSLPYHQDSRILARLAPHLGPLPVLINLWIPFEDCGVDRPGLELVNRPTAKLLPAVSAQHPVYGGMGVEIAPETVGFSDLWHPPFAAGDFFLFKGTTVHRTHVTPAMTHERISADIRLL
jgi:hypothetical protein